MSNLSKVVLLEFIDEYEKFQKYITANNSDINDYTIIVIEGELQVYLKKTGTYYQNTLPYFGNASIKRILLKWDDISRYLEKNFKFTDNNAVKNVYIDELLHYLELMFNYMAKILETLEGLYNKNSSIELYACNDSGLTSSVFITEDRLLGLLVRQFAESKGVGYCLFGEKDDPIKQNTYPDVPQNGSLVLASHFQNILKSYIHFFRKSVILVPNSGYGFKQLMGDIRNKFHNVLFISTYNDKEMKWHQVMSRNLIGVFAGHYYINIDVFSENNASANIKPLKDQVHALFDKESKGAFEFQGIDLKGLIEDKVAKALLPHLTQMSLYSDNVKKFMRKFDMKLYMSPLGRGLWYVIAEHFRNAGKASLFVSHGTHPKPTNKYHDISIFNMCKGFMLGSYSHIALNTPVQEEHLNYFKKKYNKITSETIKVGPLTFSNLDDTEKGAAKKKLGIECDEIVITHAVSIKRKRGQRYYFIETFDEFIASLSDIINVVNSFDRMRLIIRVHPGFYLTNEELESLLPESSKVIFNRKGPFSGVLAATDFLASYSSTTIDEALLNMVPVLLYDKWNRYNHFNTGVYGNPQSSDIFPVCYVNSEDKLKSALEYLSGKVNPARRESFDVSKYRYSKNYTDNFYKFFDIALNSSGGDK